MPTAEFRQPIFCPCTSVNSQQMERKIQFLKANFGANFDAIGFFKEFKFMNKKDGESDLIDVVNAICSWKSDSDVKRWALEMKQNGFKDFRTEDTERYWTMVAEEASAFAQQKAFAAIRKSVYEDMENERAESPEKRRRSNNQEEPVRLYSPYRSPAHEQQYAVPFDTRITQKQKEKKRYNYLLGAGKRDVILQNDSVMWQINEENISRKLLKFRSACIAMVDKNQSLPSVTCEFALNCIFYMDANSAEEFDLDASTWNIIEKQLKTLYPVADVPTGIETILYSLAKTARNEYSACRRLITSWTEEESELAVMMVNNILQTYSPSATSSQEANEDSFITSVLRPALMPFLQETTYLKRAGCDGRVEGSRGRLVSRDRFADFSMAYTYGDIKQTLLITEVKPPKKCRNGHRPDLYKLGNEMKDTMDKIIKDGIHNEKIVCIGLLVEGYKCTVFVMDLLFHAMYRLFPVTTFHFPEDHYDLRRLVDAYEGLLTMRTLLLQTARACHHANIYATVLNDRLHYTVPSFDTPKRLKGEE